MTNAEFNPLYRDRELRGKLRELCRDLFVSNRAAWNRGAPDFGPAFEAGELEQAAWEYISELRPGQAREFYLKSVKNHLLTALRVAKRRCEILPETDMETGVIGIAGQTGRVASIRSLVWGSDDDFPGEEGARKRDRDR